MAKPLLILVGVGGGLGLALARRFAEGGFMVGMIARDEKRLAGLAAQLAAAGFKASALAADAAEPDALAQAIATLSGAHGEPQGLIYNAAMIEPARFLTPSGIETASYENAGGWQARGTPASLDYLTAAFNVNVRGALQAAQLCAPAMMARRHGFIFFTGGVLAFEPWLEWGVTALGKAALRSLGGSLFKELKLHGVQVSTIAIHGTMKAGTAYDPAAVADFYWHLHHQPMENWQADAHFRPDGRPAIDPDQGKDRS